MRISNVFLYYALAAALSGPASAEVYESRDAEGNTVFSDRPSQGAKKIEVPTTNAADSLAIPPRPPQSTETPTKPRERAAYTDSDDWEVDDEKYYYGGDYGDDIDDRIRRERRRDDGKAEPITERPRVEPHRNTSRPAGGGGGRR